MADMIKGYGRREGRGGARAGLWTEVGAKDGPWLGQWYVRTLCRNSGFVAQEPLENAQKESTDIKSN